MKKTDAVSIVRKIRDKQNKEITGKSAQDIIVYFHKKASEIAKRVKKYKLNPF